MVSIECLNGGLLRDEGTGVLYCDCPPGYQGKNCETFTQNVSSSWKTYILIATAVIALCTTVLLVYLKRNVLSTIISRIRDRNFKRTNSGTEKAAGKRDNKDDISEEMEGVRVESPTATMLVNSEHTAKSREHESPELPSLGTQNSNGSSRSSLTHSWENLSTRAFRIRRQQIQTVWQDSISTNSISSISSLPMDINSLAFMTVNSDRFKGYQTDAKQGSSKSESTADLYSISAQSSHMTMNQTNYSANATTTEFLNNSEINENFIITDTAESDIIIEAETTESSTTEGL